MSSLKRGLIYLWTGSGAGKTTSALGTALRAIGHGKKVVIIQFMKKREDIGEYKIKDRLYPLYEIYQFGRREWIDLKSPSEEDKKLAKRGLEFAKKIMLEKKPFLLILDEINLAVATGLLSLKEVLSFLDMVPKEVTVYLTGRHAPKALIDRADFATEIVPIKHPISIGIKGREGIDY